MKVIEPQTSKGPKENFDGDVYITAVLSGDGESRVRIANVHFSPGAHTAWHSHAVGQYLHVTEGVAFVQEQDGEVKILKPGATIYTPPNTRHWHGASPQSFMIHQAIWESGGNNQPDINWQEHIESETYDNAVKQLNASSEEA